MEATIQYFGKRLFFYKKVLDFHALPKFCTTHLGVKITGPQRTECIVRICQLSCTDPASCQAELQVINGELQAGGMLVFFLQCKLNLDLTPLNALGSQISLYLPVQNNSSQILSPWQEEYSWLRHQVVVPDRRVTQAIVGQYDNHMPESTMSPSQGLRI